MLAPNQEYTQHRLESMGYQIWDSFLKETKHCTEVTEYLAGLGNACRAHGPDAAVGNAAVFLLLMAYDDIFRIPEVIFHIRNEIESDLL